MVPPACGTISRRSGAAFEGPAQDQVRHGAGGVEDELDQRGSIAKRGLLHAGGQGRMEEHHGLAPVKFVEDRIQAAVPEVHAVVVGQQHDAVQFQRPERIVDLGQRSVHVGQRQARKAAETARVAADCLGRRLVRGAGHPPCRGGIVGSGEHRGPQDHRQDRGRDALPVHHLQRCLGLPGGEAAEDRRGRQRRLQFGWHVMRVHIDTARSNLSAAARATLMLRHRHLRSSLIMRLSSHDRPARRYQRFITSPPPGQYRSALSSGGNYPGCMFIHHRVRPRAMWPSRTRGVARLAAQQPIPGDKRQLGHSHRAKQRVARIDITLSN